MGLAVWTHEGLSTGSAGRDWRRWELDLLLSLVVRRRFASRASTPEALGVGVYSPADVEVSGMVMPCSRGSGASQPSIASYVPNVG